MNGSYGRHPSVVSEMNIEFEPAIWRVTPTFLSRCGRIRAWVTKNGFALGLGGIVLLGTGLRVYALGYPSFSVEVVHSCPAFRDDNLASRSCRSKRGLKREIPIIAPELWAAGIASGFFQV